MWSLDLNKNNENDNFKICHLLSVSSTVFLAFCRGQKLISFQLEGCSAEKIFIISKTFIADNHIRINKITQFHEFVNDNWSIHHLQNISPESNAVIFCRFF